MRWVVLIQLLLVGCSSIPKDEVTSIDVAATMSIAIPVAMAYPPPEIPEVLEPERVQITGASAGASAGAVAGASVGASAGAWSSIPKLVKKTTTTVTVTELKTEVGVVKETKTDIEEFVVPVEEPPIKWWDVAFDGSQKLLTLAGGMLAAAMAYRKFKTGVLT